MYSNQSYNKFFHSDSESKRIQVKKITSLNLYYIDSKFNLE